VQLKLVNCILTVSLLLRSPKKDVQLKTLQSLAAHMKLLLDCPEQFWRLLEAREYLDAAWLFLVARVVHHSLVDEDEDDVWTDQGIDVLVQFPLVQRQWDAINGFLNQISHRAIQSLREEMTVQVGPEDE
jgi:conserved oligomeric Golgi complex subunit 1